VACRWQIRHKLLIGFGLVVGIVSLLLAGTIKGLASYRATTNSIDSKLVELNAAQAFKLSVGRLANPIDAQPNSSMPESEVLLVRSKEAREALLAYRERFELTLQKRRDPDKGEHEALLIEACEEWFKRLDKAIRDEPPVLSLSMLPSQSLRNVPAVDQAIRGLMLAANQLQDAIYDDLYRRIAEAKKQTKNSLTLVLSTSSLGVLLLAGLLRFFYRWTFAPIRDLQQGVGRVAQGNFGHRIEVHSGDEMEELAAAFNDMTRRLQEMYRDLERQVNERSRQLVRSERLASVGFLAAGVAHEINNPLASIVFCSEALERRLQPLLRSTAAGAADHETVNKYLKMIQDESLRCKKITQRLLEFSRGGEHSRERTDLVELVQSVLDVVQHHEASRNKRVLVESGGPLVAWINAPEIKAVVLNLVINALESMDEGGTLTIRLARHDTMAELVFTDTGCGMTPEVLENIFEPFFTRSRTGKGTGLGLSISHRIISQHGGEIEAVSAGLNQGSTFTVRLPLRPAEPVKEEAIGHAAA
jgi:signal transduction histidine kinase